MKYFAGENQDEQPPVEELLDELERTNAILHAVKDAMDRMNAMPLVDTRPSPSVPSSHPLDDNEKEVGE